MSKNEPGFDLGNLDTAKFCNVAQEVELKHPITQAPLGVFVPVLGKDSDLFRNHIREQLNAKARKMAQARKRGKDPEVETVEAGEAEGLELLTLCIVESGKKWRTEVKDGQSVNTVFLNGEHREMTVPNVTMLLSIVAFRKQIDEAIGDLELFMKS